MKPSVDYCAHRLGKMVKAEREKRGESQHLFSFRAACHRNTLARVENGDTGVSIGTIIQILRVLDREDMFLQMIVGKWLPPKPEPAWPE